MMTGLPLYILSEYDLPPPRGRPPETMGVVYSSTRSRAPQYCHTHATLGYHEIFIHSLKWGMGHLVDSYSPITAIGGTYSQVGW